MSGLFIPDGQRLGRADDNGRRGREYGGMLTKNTGRPRRHRTTVLQLPEVQRQAREDHEVHFSHSRGSQS